MAWFKVFLEIQDHLGQAQGALRTFRSEREASVAQRCESYEFEMNLIFTKWLLVYVLEHIHNFHVEYFLSLIVKIILPLY